MPNIPHSDTGVAPVLPAFILFNKSEIHKALKAAHVDWARIEFDGESDEGRLVAHYNVPQGSLNILTNDRDGAALQTTSLHAAMEQMVLDLLDYHHYGWEIGSGSYGVVTFDPLRDKITVDYSERIIETEFYEHEV